MSVFTSVLWASCHPVCVCLYSSRYGSDFPKKSWEWLMTWPLIILTSTTELVKPDPSVPCYQVSELPLQSSPPCYRLFPLHKSTEKQMTDGHFTHIKIYLTTLWRSAHSLLWSLFQQVTGSLGRAVGSVFYLKQPERSRRKDKRKQRGSKIRWKSMRGQITMTVYQGCWTLRCDLQHVKVGFTFHT